MEPELRSWASGVWTASQPLRFWGVETGARMVVFRGPSGALVVHSPLPPAPGPQVRAALDALGPVVALVAPSRFHYLGVKGWAEAYPEARRLACPGLADRRPDVPWSATLSERDEPEPEWAGWLEQAHFGARPLESEVVFFHPQSRTMVCADAVFNLGHHERRATRIVAALLGQRAPGVTWLERLSVRDRARARREVERMLAWHPERILLAHGPPIERDAEAVLRRAFDWL